jgi:pimeloyl-ACP methyl ester carboxylesterase
MLGYSMGGWLACAVVVHHPARLASVIIGCWDPIGETSGSGMSLEDLLAMGREQVPEQMEWITPDVEPALRCCLEALDEIDGVETALARFERPVLLWNGDDDASGDAARRLAARHEHVQFPETTGEHMAAWFNDERGVARTALRAFVDRARETELPAST